MRNVYFKGESFKKPNKQNMLASQEHRGAKLGKQNVVRCSAKHEIVGSTNNEETAANTPGHPMKLSLLREDI